MQTFNIKAEFYMPNSDAVCVSVIQVHAVGMLNAIKLAHLNRANLKTVLQVW